MSSTSTKTYNSNKRKTHKSGKTITNSQTADYTCNVSVVELKKKEKLIEDLKSTNKSLETENNHMQEQVKFLERNNKTLSKDLERIQTQARYLEQENKKLLLEQQKLKKKDKNIKTVAKEMYNLSLKSHEAIGETYEKLMELSIN